MLHKIKIKNDLLVIFQKVGSLDLSKELKLYLTRMSSDKYIYIYIYHFLLGKEIQ